MCSFSNEDWNAQNSVLLHFHSVPTLSYYVPRDEPASWLVESALEMDGRPIAYLFSEAF